MKKLKVILSHVNTDFDALASMIAAKKLYPDAEMVITDKQQLEVKQFLAIYRDSIDIKQEHTIDWSKVNHVILVDVANIKRVGAFAEKIRPDVTYTVYDHHPPSEENVLFKEGKIEEVGATITMLVEEIRRRNIDFTSFEATVFGLGIYTDTGNFTNSNTTPRDLEIASYLMEKGMKLNLVNQFSEQIIDIQEQNKLFHQLLINAKEYEIDGLNIIISTHEQKKFQGGLAALTRKLLNTTGADACIAVVEMQKRVYVVGRADSNRVNFLPLMDKLGGGGHEQAASAAIKNGVLEEIIETVRDYLPKLIQPAITAEAIMVYPVKTIAPTTTIEEAANLMYRYGHTGFPVCENRKLIGIISRRDIDKATHHGLGHAPVKAYMSTNVVTIEPDTPLEEIENTMIKHNIGRLPVVKDGKIVGIISRTNVIEVLHNENLKRRLEKTAQLTNQNNLAKTMKQQLPGHLYTLLEQIGEGADDYKVNAYMIGGIVRDLILERENDDIDIVIEGDGIAFAKYLADRYGGEVKIHETFGTATWHHPDGTKIDITTSRFEYYEHPAALPTVEHSNLREDLSRRDFTINAMAIQINKTSFGEIIDFFNGREHLAKRTITILHNLSFVEDPTRILRAVRFETRFGFKMDKQTFELARRSMDKVKDLSATRISNELQKLFSEEKPLKALHRLFELEFWSTVIDDFSGEATIMEHARKFHDTLEKHLSLINKKTRWFLYMMLVFFEQKDPLEKIRPYALNRKEMKLAEEVYHLKEIWSDSLAESLSSLHEHLQKLSNEAILFFITHPKQKEAYDFGLEYVKSRHEMPKLLTGKDLKALGIPSGPAYSKLLLAIEQAYLEKKIATKEEAVRFVREKTARK